MGVTRLLPLYLILLAAVAHAKETASFKRILAGTEIDWSAGIITAQAGAAADIRMPNPNAARPGAERRARAAAEEKVRAALRELGQGGKVDDKAVSDKATVSRTEYQSNGGVVLWLSLRFSDLAPARPAAVSLRVASMPFTFAPVVASAGKSASLGFATYRPASECPKGALPARRDGDGRLALAGSDGKVVDSLAGAAVVIYLEKAQP